MIACMVLYIACKLVYELIKQVTAQQIVVIRKSYV